MQEVKTQCADELKLSPEDVDKLKVGDVANLNPNHKVRSLANEDLDLILINWISILVLLEVYL